MFKENYVNPFMDEVFNAPQEGEITLNFEHNTNLHNHNSPFLAEYEYADGTVSSNNPETELYFELMDNLFDEEFDYAVHELIDQADQFLEQRGANEILHETEGYDQRVQSYLYDHFLPLQRELETAVQNMANDIQRTDIMSRPEAEIEQFLAQYEAPSTLAPEFQNFFGSFVEKAKNAVKFVADKAKQGLSAVGKLLPINKILEQLKKLAAPVIKQVLKVAIGKLPKELQPIAKDLAQKMLKLEMAEMEVLENQEQSNDFEFEFIQGELDAHIANLLTNENPIIAENAVQQFVNEVENPHGQTDNVTPDIHVARERFIQDFMRMQEGEDPSPAIQNFLPAVMALKPIIKTAVGIIGRDKIVNFLAGAISPLISKFVGQQSATKLSKGLANAGLKLIGFEMTQTDEPRLSAETIMATVEKVGNDLSNLPAEVYADQELLQALVYESFETAAAAQFPEQMMKPENREAAKSSGTWLYQPAGSRRKFYKKYTQVFEVELSRQLAESIIVYEGRNLASFLQAGGLNFDTPQKVKIHLFEAIKSTTKPRIARFEKNTRGLGGRVGGWKGIHPLTQDNAAKLLQEPGLGSAFAEGALGQPLRSGIGERYFFVESGGLQLELEVVNVSSPKISLSGKYLVLNFRLDETKAGKINNAKDLFETIKNAVRAANVKKAYHNEIEEEGIFTKIGGFVRPLKKPISEIVGIEGIDEIIEWITDENTLSFLDAAKNNAALASSVFNKFRATRGNLKRSQKMDIKVSVSHNLDKKGVKDLINRAKADKGARKGVKTYMTQSISKVPTSSLGKIKTFLKSLVRTESLIDSSFSFNIK